MKKIYSLLMLMFSINLFATADMDVEPGVKDHRPVCKYIGSKSEGWYWADTGERITWAQCAEATPPECRHYYTRSEGWYSEGWSGYDHGHDGLISYDFCHETVGLKLDLDSHNKSFRVKKQHPVVITLKRGMVGPFGYNWDLDTMQYNNSTMTFINHREVPNPDCPEGMIGCSYKMDRFYFLTERPQKGYFFIKNTNAEVAEQYGVKTLDEYQVFFDIYDGEKYCLTYQEEDNSYHAINFSSEEEAKRHLHSIPVALHNVNIAGNACSENLPPCPFFYDPVCGEIETAKGVSPRKTHSNTCGFSVAVRSAAGTEGWANGYYNEGECEKRCWENSQCADNEFCKLNGCGAKSGVCEKRPVELPTLYHPVCGCDNRSYVNEFIAYYHGVNIDYEGFCK